MYGGGYTDWYDMDDVGYGATAGSIIGVVGSLLWVLLRIFYMNIFFFIHQVRPSRFHTDQRTISNMPLLWASARIASEAWASKQCCSPWYTNCGVDVIVVHRHRLSPYPYFLQLERSLSSKYDDAYQDCFSPSDPPQVGSYHCCSAVACATTPFAVRTGGSAASGSNRDNRYVWMIHLNFSLSWL